jgi:hypothetical protein
LVRAVRYLASDDAEGISGHRLYIELPPPPLVIESLLPEVRAALDENVRQDDLEASLFDDFDFEDGEEELALEDSDEDPEPSLDENELEVDMSNALEDELEVDVTVDDND